jgi:hypothetical protein
VLIGYPGAVDTLSAGCDPGAIARGQELNDGGWIDALGLRCGKPLVAP